MAIGELVKQKIPILNHQQEGWTPGIKGKIKEKNLCGE
jgi:hypothetical protein